MNCMGQEFEQGTVRMALLHGIWGLSREGAVDGVTRWLRVGVLELSGDLFTHMPGRLMLAVIWDLSWGCQLEHVHMASPYGLSFLTAWKSHSNRVFTQWLRAPAQIFQLTRLKLYHLS